MLLDVRLLVVYQSKFKKKKSKLNLKAKLMLKLTYKKLVLKQTYKGSLNFCFTNIPSQGHSK